MIAFLLCVTIHDIEVVECKEISGGGPSVIRRVFQGPLQQGVTRSMAFSFGDRGDAAIPQRCDIVTVTPPFRCRIPDCQTCMRLDQV